MRVSIPYDGVINITRNMATIYLIRHKAYGYAAVEKAACMYAKKYYDRTIISSRDLNALTADIQDFADEYVQTRKGLIPVDVTLTLTATGTIIMKIRNKGATSGGAEFRLEEVKYAFEGE